MASAIEREQTLNNGIITVEIRLISIDASDDALIQKFGDIRVDPSGEFKDQNDPTFAPFRVEAGDPVYFFAARSIRCLFVGDALTMPFLQRRAKIWGDNIEREIQNQILNLRALVDTTSSKQVVNI